jgi:hypothetical protein
MSNYPVTLQTNQKRRKLLKKKHPQGLLTVHRTWALSSKHEMKLAQV